MTQVQLKEVLISVEEQILLTNGIRLRFAPTLEILNRTNDIIWSYNRIMTKKYVNGVLMDLTPEEETEYANNNSQWAGDSANRHE